jgi:hypothetical protein
MEMIGGEWGNQRITTYLQALFPSAATSERVSLRNKDQKWRCACIDWDINSEVEACFSWIPMETWIIGAIRITIKEPGNEFSGESLESVFFTTA